MNGIQNIPPSKKQNKARLLRFNNKKMNNIFKKKISNKSEQTPDGK